MCGFLRIAIEILSLPVEYRRTFLAAFPPGFVGVRYGDICEDRVVRDHLERILVGLAVGAGYHTEVTCLRVDSAKSTVFARVQPGNVIAECPDFPAWQRIGWNQHRKIGFSASRWEGAGNVMRFAFRAFQSNNQHVFGKPAFQACLVTGNTKRMAFLAQQRIATVTRTNALDRQFLREVHDEAAVRIQVTDRVQPFNELSFFLDTQQRLLTHACHQFHVDHDVGTVGNLNAAAGIGRFDGTHAVRNDVHRTTLHAAVEQRIDLCVRLVGPHPVIVRACIVFFRGADKRQVFHASDVTGVGAMQVAVWIGFRVQGFERAVIQHDSYQVFVLGVRPVTPDYRVRSGHCRRFLDPRFKGFEIRRHSLYSFDFAEASKCIRAP